MCLKERYNIFIRHFSLQDTIRREKLIPQSNTRSTCSQNRGFQHVWLLDRHSCVYLSSFFCFLETISRDHVLTEVLKQFLQVRNQAIQILFEQETKSVFLVTSTFGFVRVKATSFKLFLQFSWLTLLRVGNCEKFEKRKNVWM